MAYVVLFIGAFTLGLTVGGVIGAAICYDALLPKDRDPTESGVDPR